MEYTTGIDAHTFGCLDDFKIQPKIVMMSDNTDCLNTNYSLQIHKRFA